MKETGVNLMAQGADEARPLAWVRVSRDRGEVFVALAAFAVLCLVVLSSASRLVEPDDYAYRASILAGFAALEAAVFVRYTDMVVLGCAVVAVVAAWKLRAVALFGLGAWSFAVMHDFWLFPGPAVINGPAWLNAS